MVKALLSMLLVACAALVGCRNTVEGAGQDISNAGEAVSDATR